MCSSAILSAVESIDFLFQNNIYQIFSSVAGQFIQSMAFHRIPEKIDAMNPASSLN
jgi:hypothetical protein